MRVSAVVGPLIYIALVATPQPVAAEQATARTVDAARIGRAADARMQRHRAPALSIAIALDGKPTWSVGFGFADPARGVPATSGTSYRLASVTKSITATAVMMLAEKGLLDLDAPIQRYCPAYPEKRWPVTARLLLAHLGGVRHHGLLEVVRPNTRHYDSVVASLERFKNDDLIAEPPDNARAPSATGTAYFSKGLLYKATGGFARLTSARGIDVSDRLTRLERREPAGHAHVPVSAADAGDHHCADDEHGGGTVRRISSGDSRSHSAPAEASASLQNIA